MTQEQGANPGYQSYGLARADEANINGLKDFAGKKVCFVDPSSTSGFLYPTAGLIEAGVIKSGSEGDLSAAMSPIYAGGHDSSALAIANGDCDAGFAFDTMVDKTMIAKGDLEPGQLKTVWKSETIAGSVFAANDSLGSEAIGKLKTLFAEKVNVPNLGPRASARAMPAGSPTNAPGDSCRSRTRTTAACAASATSPVPRSARADHP